MHVWDAKTYEEVFVHKEDSSTINAVDFSPGSTHRLNSASDNGTVIVWDFATRERVQTLHHENWVVAAKYSPQGDRIATATLYSVRVYDSNDGHLLMDIKETVTQWYNTSLLWSNNHLLVVSDDKIKQFEASTGSAVSKWPAIHTNGYSCIVIAKHGEFFAYCATRTLIFRDMATHTELGLIQHPQHIRSVALSPDHLFVATGGEGGKIIIQGLSRIIVSSMY